MNKIMRALLSAVPAVAVMAGTAWSQATRSSLNTYNNQNITTNGRGAITGSIVNHLFGQVINGTGFLNDTNTWSKANLLLNPVSSSTTTDGALFTFQNSSLTASQIITPFNSGIFFDGMRSVMNCAPGTVVLACQALGAYIYNTNPRGNSNANRDNAVGIFVEAITGVDNGYTWVMNSAQNDKDLGGVSHPAHMIGYEMDQSVFNAASAANGLSIIINGLAEPISGVAIGIDAISIAQYTNALVINSGSIQHGNDAIIEGAVFSVSNTTKGVGSASNDIAFDIFDTQSALSNPPGGVQPIGNNGGSACTSGTFVFTVGGGVVNTGVGGSAATVTGTVAGGVITSLTTLTTGIYSTEPTMPAPLTIVPGGTTDGCSSPPTIAGTMVPRGHGVSMLANISGANSGVIISDNVTNAGFGATLAPGNLTFSPGNSNQSVSSATINTGGGNYGSSVSGTLTWGGSGCFTPPVLNVTTNGGGVINAVSSVATAGSCGVVPFNTLATWVPGGGLSAGTGATFNLTMANGPVNIALAPVSTGVVQAPLLRISAIPTSAGGGGLYVCVDSAGNTYKKSACP